MAHINYPAKVLFKSANPGTHPAPRPRSLTLHLTHLSRPHGLPAPAPSPPLTPLPSPSIPFLHTLLPVITMLIGLVWFRKSYPVRDYIVVALLVLGLYVFMNGDAKASPKGTNLPTPTHVRTLCGTLWTWPTILVLRALSTCPFPFTSPRPPPPPYLRPGTGYGIFLVTLSMFGSAGVPMVQEHCMHKYNASIEELLYHCYLGSTGISFILALTSGELWQGAPLSIASSPYLIPC